MSYNYEITIVKRISKTVKRKEWTRKFDGDVAKVLHGLSDEEKAKFPEQYGYIDSEKDIIEEIQVYKQTMDEINLTKVIAAVNGITGANCV